MARTIRVQELGRRGIEVKEVELDEAKRILEDAATWGSIVVDAKSREIIWEIGPGVEEIVILETLGGG